MAGSDAVAGGNLLFENWRAAMQLQIDAAKGHAENMVKYAEANLKNAQAVTELAKAAILQTVLKQLQIAYRELNTYQVKHNQKIAWIEQQRSNLRIIAMGHKASGPAAVNLWASFTALLPDLPDADRDELAATPVENGWRSGDNYSHVSQKDKPCENVPDDVTDLFALLAWLDDKQIYMPKLGRPVANVVTKAVRRVADAAIPSRQAIEHEIASHTEAVYAIWDPVTFAGLDRPKKP